MVFSPWVHFGGIWESVWSWGQGQSREVQGILLYESESLVNLALAAESLNCIVTSVGH